MLDNYEPEQRIADSNDPDFRRLVSKDLEETLNGCALAIDDDLKEPLVVQSVLGHAQSGHKTFRHENVSYPDATLPDIIAAAGMDVVATKTIRQNLIDDVFEWVELAKKGQVDNFTLKGRPLLGVNFLRKYRIDPEYALKGMVLAACMDNFGWRMKTIERYPLTIENQPLLIGGGEMYPVIKDKVLEWNILGIDKLAHEEFTEDDINFFKQEGIIVDEEYPGAEPAYIRRKIGEGTSDDTAFILVGLFYQNAGKIASQSAFLGAFIVDGVDTYDKCVLNPLAGGYDERIGINLMNELPGIVSDEDITTLIYYSVKQNGPRVVSSSHKRLVEIQTKLKSRKPTLLHHLHFLETGDLETYKVGFEQMPSWAFYTAVDKRIRHYMNNHGVASK